MRQFDFYEFAGVIAPGTVILLAAGLIWPDYLGALHKLAVTLGGFGLALVLAYVGGHLLQAVGNLLESVWWKINGGRPSDWPCTGKGDLLSKAQIKQLQERVRTDRWHSLEWFDNLLAKTKGSVLISVHGALSVEGSLL